MDPSDQTLDEFLSSTASERVAPAGGTASAVVGATGAALCEMVCIHTIGNDESAQGDVADARDELRRVRERLLDLADADARTVSDLFPADDGPDESTLKRSIGVPLAIADACLTVLELAATVAADGTRTAVVDAGTGVFLARSALRASVFTARSNLALVSDPSFVARIERRTAAIERDAEEASEQAMQRIEQRA
ncbi:MAG: cyclodeaminase/cyclohydrolase family protein [Halobacteriales archaeon]